MSTHDSQPIRSTSTRQASHQPTRSVVLPIYGEYPPLWMDLTERILAAGWDEIVLSVDAPTEVTDRALSRYSEDPRIVVSRSEGRRGKGGALLDGLEATSEDVVGFVDADGAVTVEELTAVYGLVASGDADVCIGSRGYSGRRRARQSLLRRAFAFGYGALARRATGVPVYDFQCGVKACSREAWDAVADELTEHGFAFDTEFIAQLHHAGFQIRELSIDWTDPGDSSVSVVRDVPRMFASLRRIRRTVSGLTSGGKPNGRLRVALVSAYPPGKGHLAEYGETLADSLGYRDDVDLTVLAQRSDFAPSVEHRGDYVVRRLWARDSLSGTFALLRELLSGDYDVVHFNVHMTYFGTKNRYRFFGLALPTILSRLSDARVVATLHDLLEVVEDEVIEEEVGWVQALGAVFATQVLLLCDATTVTSDEYLDIVESRYKATEVYHVPHGTFRTDQPTIPTFDPPLRVLVFGHLGPSKDVETVVEAIELVQAGVPDAELWIAGDSHPGYPGYREGLEKQFATKPGVRFTGYVEDYELDAIWTESTLLVLPYRTCTGVSGVFQLAKSYGVPVIAFDVDGIRTSTAGTGGRAVFVAPGDVTALAAEITALWHDRERLEELACENAEASVEWTISDTADRLVEIFEGNDRRSIPDLLDQLPDEPCPDPGCPGFLTRRRFKGDHAVVCTACETPTVRTWGEA